MNILTIISTNKRKKNYNFHLNTSKAYLYTAIEKMKSHKLCCYATPQVSHTIVEAFFFTQVTLSFSLSLSVSPLGTWLLLLLLRLPSSHHCLCLFFFFFSFLFIFLDFQFFSFQTFRKCLVHVCK